MRANDSPPFNSYHKWLGIPLSEQPANHYRLLGLAVFESDSDVIAAAADRQMAHVKQFATGQYRAESQRLLNELATARVTLLHLHRKAAYDRSLERNLAERREPQPPQRTANKVPTPPVIQSQESAGFEFANLPSRSASRRRARPAPNPALPWLVVLAGVGVIAGILIYAAATAPPASEPVVAVTPQPPVPRSDALPRPRPQQREPFASQREVAPHEERKSSQLAERAGAPERLRPEPERPTPLKEAVKPTKLESIDLELDSRQQNVPLQQAGRYQVIGLKGCRAKSTVSPLDGKLAIGRAVEIKIEGERPVTLMFSLKPRPDEQALLKIEAVVTTDNDRELPYTLANVGRVIREITKQGEDAAAALDAMNAEKRQLSTFLGGPGMKPLVDVGIAKSRIKQLEQALPEQTAIVETLRADLAVAERVQEFAEHLHKDCSIELEILEE